MLWSAMSRMRQPRDMGGVDVEAFLSPQDALSSLVDSSRRGLSRGSL